MTAVVELIKTMKWVMEGVSAAYKVGESHGLRDELLLHESCLIEICTHHGPGLGMQVASFTRMRTGAKVLHLSSARLMSDDEVTIRSMLLQAFASYLQWCEHDRDQALWASSQRRELRKVKKPKVPMYGDAKWTLYLNAVNTIWCTRAATTE